MQTDDDLIRKLSQEVNGQVYPDGDVFDVVKDGTCVTQLAGFDGARRAIDRLIEACEK